MNSNIPKLFATSSKIQIKQHVPNGSIRKGPHAIERSLVPDEVVIKRRFGEGSKPLFQRDDIVVNPESVTNTADAQNDKQIQAETRNNTEDISNRRRKERHISTDSSSPERYRKYHTSQKNESEIGSSNNTTRRTKTAKPTSDGKYAVRRDVSPPPNRHRRIPEKIPYFVDEVREQDRIRRKYGSTKNKSPPASSKFRRRRSISKSCSRSHSRDSMKTKQRSQTRRTYFRRSISVDRYMGNNSKRERETEKSRTDKDLGGTPSHHYQHTSKDRAKNLRRHRSSRTHSRSRTRSRERSSRIGTQSSERHRYRHNDNDEKNGNDERNMPQPQIITIPVPVPADFMNYGYPTWPTPTQWSPQPSRYGAPPYPMPTFLPAVLPPLRHPMPPYGLPPQPIRYGGPGYRLPSQYGASRPWRPNFRSKNL
uniref:Female-specific transformer protein n=1 Tax=Bactrocera oleae TaxID=104688 RepID=Q65AC0_BACOL|nr:female-specific transformer protein [Bactrocera oleae]CAG29243.1 female-specific transformer protein [Bactrocera oleae]